MRQRSKNSTVNSALEIFFVASSVESCMRLEFNMASTASYGTQRTGAGCTEGVETGVTTAVRGNSFDHFRHQIKPRFHLWRDFLKQLALISLCYHVGSQPLYDILSVEHGSYCRCIHRLHLLD